ncbi:MAG: divergent PAP2 family protein [Candidatus Ornithospirochaeta sp.]|nr:divergent PAP2 family protein [Candidatus Ornithospirochaeta sp.]
MNMDLLHNAPFWSALSSLVIAQALKPLINMASGRGWDRHMFITTGGMPSSHTSTVTAMTMSLAMTEGIGSSIFVVALVFSLIIMNDAMNVRLETGKQAKVLNEWSQILSELHKNGPFAVQNFKTMVGHSMFQVLVGFILGIAVGFTTTYLMVYV